MKLSCHHKLVSCSDYDGNVISTWTSIVLIVFCRFDMEQAVLVYRHHLGGTQIHMEGLEQQQQQLMV